MTMLDSMRRHRHWLKWVLLLVVISFVAFYVPDFLRDRTNGSGSAQTVATVDGEPISAMTFRRAYQQQIATVQERLRGGIRRADGQAARPRSADPPATHRTAYRRRGSPPAGSDGFGRRSCTAHSTRSPRSTRTARSTRRFIRACLAFSVRRSPRPSSRKACRQSLLVEKLRGALTEWVNVRDSEVDDEYKRRNEKVKVEIVVLSADKFADQVNVTDKDIADWFDSAQGELSRRREAEDQVPARRHGADRARRRSCRRRRSSATTRRTRRSSRRPSRCARATSC